MQLVPTGGGGAALKRVSGVDQTPTTDYLLDPKHNIELGVAYLSVLDNNEYSAVSKANSSSGGARGCRCTKPATAICADLVRP